VFWNLYVRAKNFSIEKQKIFHTKFHSTTVYGSESELSFRIRIQPKLSDSDPQHCMTAPKARKKKYLTFNKNYLVFINFIAEK
jgi:hypothetical protein